VRDLEGGTKRFIINNKIVMMINIYAITEESNRFQTFYYKGSTEPLPYKPKSENY
jgi:hypothetical protein